MTLTALCSAGIRAMLLDEQKAIEDNIRAGERAEVAALKEAVVTIDAVRWR